MGGKEIGEGEGVGGEGKWMSDIAFDHHHTLINCCTCSLSI